IEPDIVDDLRLDVADARELLTAFNIETANLPIRCITYYFDNTNKHIGTLCTLSMTGYGYYLWIDVLGEVQVLRDGRAIEMFMVKRHPEVSIEEIYSNMITPSTFGELFYRIYRGNTDYRWRRDNAG